MDDTYRNWIQNIRESAFYVEQNQGPRQVALVCGTTEECEEWAQRFQLSSNYTSNADGSTKIIALAENPPIGNLFGVLRAWREIQQSASGISDMTLLSVVLGKGSRLSPFTQALGNRKPAFPTARSLPPPLRRMWISELANWCLNPCIGALRQSGFNGIVVKWGDEALIPGKIWTKSPPELAGADVVRFVSHMTPTPDSARHKEWLVSEASNCQLVKEIPRQEYADLMNRMAESHAASRTVSVNLGSFAVSHRFLKILWDILGSETTSGHRGPDWDPYFWFAFCCEDRAEWETERARERARGHFGIEETERYLPQFFDIVQRIRERMESLLGRPPKIAVLDFGDVFWVDFGTHQSLREHFELMRQPTALGDTARELSGITNEPDEHGNIIENSSIQAGATIRNSVLINTIIDSPSSCITNGVLIGGRYGHVEMPEGGIAIDCVTPKLIFQGTRGVAFRALGREVVIAPAGRVTDFALSSGVERMMASEEMTSFAGSMYSDPILNNKRSFEEMAKLMGKWKLKDIERMWETATTL